MFTHSLTYSMCFKHRVCKPLALYIQGSINRWDCDACKFMKNLFSRTEMFEQNKARQTNSMIWRMNQTLKNYWKYLFYLHINKQTKLNKTIAWTDNDC